MEINNLVDLTSFRSAPELNRTQIKKLLEELQAHIFKSDWVTVGIMASNDNDAINALKSISKKYSFIKFTSLDSIHADGRVFLKGNQKTGNVYIRSEGGLGEGILLTCQYEDVTVESSTFGPLPLDFFTF
tara:strand:- start:230 stop:619 length:390 start_codon:yes stop_codon:yes gene_type:complete